MYDYKIFYNQNIDLFQELNTQMEQLDYTAYVTYIKFYLSKKQSSLLHKKELKTFMASNSFKDKKQTIEPLADYQKQPTI